MSKKIIDDFKKIKTDLNENNKECSLAAFTYILSYMWDDDCDEQLDLDFGTFDNTEISNESDSAAFAEFIHLLDSEGLNPYTDRFYHTSSENDKTYENESKINFKPAICKHDMEKKFLITSFYFKCKNCNYEEN